MKNPGLYLQSPRGYYALHGHAITAFPTTEKAGQPQAAGGKPDSRITPVPITCKPHSQKRMTSNVKDDEGLIRPTKPIWLLHELCRSVTKLAS